MTMLDTLLPIGFTRAGTPVFPRRGGSPVGDGDEVGSGGGGGQEAEEQGGVDDEGQSDSGDDDSDNEDEGGEEGLGDAGKKALDDTRKERDRYKGRAREARDALKPWADLGKEFGLTPDEVRSRLQGKVKDAEGKEVDVDALRREVETKVRGEFAGKLARSQVTALAADVLQNSDDAARFLDLSDLDVDEHGNIDADEVKSLLADLVKDRPYLGKAPTKVRKPNGGGGQGNGNSGSGKPAGSVAAGMELWSKTGKKSKV